MSRVTHSEPGFNLWYTLFRRARPKHHTLSSGTSPYSPNKVVPPLPPECCLRYTIYSIKMSQVSLTFSKLPQSKYQDTHFFDFPSYSGDLTSCLGGKQSFNCCASSRGKSLGILPHTYHATCRPAHKYEISSFRKELYNKIDPVHLPCKQIILLFRGFDYILETSTAFQGIKGNSPIVSNSKSGRKTIVHFPRRFIITATKPVSFCEKK